MRTRTAVLAGTLLGGLLLLAGAGAAYAHHYADRALPGSTVAGRSVAGMTRHDLATWLLDRTQSVTVTVALDPPTPGPTPGPAAAGAPRALHLADLGYHVDVTRTVDAVFAAHTSWWSAFTVPLTRHPVTPVLGTDATRLDAAMRDLEAAAGGAPFDATVALAGDGASFVVTPAITGTRIDRVAVRAVAARAAATLTSATTTPALLPAQPAVSTQAAQTVADRANAVVARSVAVSDGSGAHLATAADKATWVRLPTGGSTTPTIDDGAVRDWVAATAIATNLTATTGVREVDADGRVLAVLTRKVDGRTVTNSDAVTADLLAALAAGHDYAGSFSYDTVAATWTDRPVAATTPGLVYAPTPGEKWVDVDLRRHTMTAYEGTTVVRGPVAMVNGAAATPTVVGTFHVYAKYAAKTMRGDNADGTRYETPDVPWVSFFYSGYALHGAPWRSSFGYAGSHGCINLPVPVAKWVYDWAAVGTAVVTHH